MESTSQSSTSAQLDSQQRTNIKQGGDTGADQSKPKPKSAKERMRAYRQRLKYDSDKYKAVKEKDATRKRDSRVGDKLSVAKLNQRRKQNLKSVHKYRENKKLSSAQVREKGPDDTILSPQTLGRALKRVETALPKSPLKRKAVITKLAISEKLWTKEKKKKKCNPVKSAPLYA